MYIYTYMLLFKPIGPPRSTLKEINCKSEWNHSFPLCNLVEKDSSMQSRKDTFRPIGPPRAILNEVNILESLRGLPKGGRSFRSVN